MSIQKYVDKLNDQCNNRYYDLFRKWTKTNIDTKIFCYGTNELCVNCQYTLAKYKDQTSTNPDQISSTIKDISKYLSKIVEKLDTLVTIIDNPKREQQQQEP